MRLVQLLLLSLVLCWPGLATSQVRQPTPVEEVSTRPAGPVFGQVVVLKDKSAGYFEDVRKVSQQVTWVRGGVEQPLERNTTLRRGDAVRTADGTCVIETPAGWRVEIGERSQVVLEETVLQRLGEVFFLVQGLFSVQVNEVELLVEGTGFKVDANSSGTGTLSVTEGAVRIRAPSGQTALVS